MKKSFKVFTLSISFIVLFLLCLTFWSFHLMEIEDHYGDLQSFYFKSNNGDLLINETERKFGVVKKDLKSIHVINMNSETDLYNWVYSNDQEAKIKLYKNSKSGINFFALL